MAQFTIDWLEEYFGCPIDDVAQVVIGRDLGDMLRMYLVDAEESYRPGDPPRESLHPKPAPLTNFLGNYLIANSAGHADSSTRARSSHNVRNLTSRLLVSSDHVIWEDPIVSVVKVAEPEDWAPKLLSAFQDIAHMAPFLIDGCASMCFPRPPDLLMEMARNAPVHDNAGVSPRELIKVWELFGQYNSPRLSIDSNFGHDLNLDPDWSVLECLEHLDTDPVATYHLQLRSRAIEQLEIAAWTASTGVWTVTTNDDRAAMSDLLLIVNDLSGTDLHLGRAEYRSFVLCNLPLPDPAGIGGKALFQVRKSDEWEHFRVTVSGALDDLNSSLDGRPLQNSHAEVEDFQRQMLDQAHRLGRHPIPKRLAESSAPLLFQYCLGSLFARSPLPLNAAAASLLVGIGAATYGHFHGRNTRNSLHDLYMQLSDSP